MAATFESMKNGSNLTTIKPFYDHPIREVPKYVFENYNDKIFTSYSPEFLASLKEKAKVITPSEILSYKMEDKQKIQKGKEFDWIYALGKLENEYLSIALDLMGVLKVENIMALNRYLSRLAENKELRTHPEFEHTPGQFRKHSFLKNAPNLPFEEVLITGLFELMVSYRFKGENFISILSSHKKYYAHKSAIIYQIAKNKKNFDELKLKDNLKGIDLAKKVRQWADKKGNIELIQWLKEKTYCSPEPSTIDSELKKVINSINDSKMHPIEKAAKILYEIVRIKPFWKANKRTAKIAAFAILLSNGYLPPVIAGEKNKKELSDCFNFTNIEENSHLKLTAFLANQISITQEKFKKSPSTFF